MHADLLTGLRLEAVIIHVAGPVELARNADRQLHHLARARRIVRFHFGCRRKAVLLFGRQRLGLHLARCLIEQNEMAVVAAYCKLILVRPDPQAQRCLGLLGVNLALGHPGRVPGLERAILAERIERFAVGGVSQANDRPFMGED